jgi:glycosyltransferase involved in cell wall biosynthesis
MASGARAGRLGFVPVRFGDDLVGGAEMLMREMADGLARRGHAVDVLTGCARDHFREAHYYEPGVSVRPSGVRVVRFRSVVSRHRADRVLGNRMLGAGHLIVRDAQYRWCNDDVRVPGLFDYLVDHASEYRAFVFAPYLYWTTVAGSMVAPERTIVLPCLHDEPAARLTIFDRMFRESRGLWFLSEPEAELARRLRPDLAPHAVIGSGVDVPRRYDPGRFRTRFGVEGPFALYAGRREAGKGFATLIDDFVTAVQRHGVPMRLVIAGPGRARLSPRARRHVVDVGILSTADRDDAMAAAAAVIQPSPFESFSRTMMEAWLAGTFVIANRASAVSVWHCRRSGAGATYSGPDELAEALHRALDPAVVDQAARGRAYVLREYTWPVVLDRVEAVLDDWFPEGG